MDTLPNEFQEYIEVSQKIAELEKRKDDLKHKMIDVFDNYNVKEWASKFGTFFLKGRTTYKFSDNMTEMEKRVAQLKKQEIAQGIATIKSSIQYVMFMPIETLKRLNKIERG